MYVYVYIYGDMHLQLDRLWARNVVQTEVDGSIEVAI